jgi:thioredoxin reductase (NADPH)
MFDVIIVGGGPAGLTAGLYASRARLKCLLLERLAPGGQVLNTHRVENYPGFPDAVSGFDLVDRMKTQAEKFGLPIRNDEVVRMELKGGAKKIFLRDEELETAAVILASGATWKKLGIEGEGALSGKGVSYCATCDGPFFMDEDVAVIGGGDTAMEEALFLTRFASKIYVIHRREKLRATPLLQERALAEPKIQFLWNTVPARILGRDGVEEIEIRNVQSGEIQSKAVKGVFVFVGTLPNTALVQGQVDLDSNGFIVTDQNMMTSVPGVFAAGDVRSKLFRQIATAVGEGAAASFSVEKYLENSQDRNP